MEWRTRVFLVAAVLALLPETLVADAAAGINNAPCRKSYTQWKTKPGHKAFAVSQSSGSVQACGFAWSAPSRAVAEKAALESCRAQKALAVTCYVIESK
jgi:hypothetical protein